MANKPRDDSINNRLIHVKDSLYKIPYRRWNGKPGNVYYVKTICSVCGKDTLQERNNHNKYPNAAICSKECRSKRVTERYDQMRIQGQFSYKKHRENGGYHQMIHAPNHPRAHQGLMPEHIIIVEQQLGRFLHKEEKIHHINMIKNDNRTENLDLMANNQEHFKSHGSLNRCVAQLIEKGYLIYDRQTKTYQVRELECVYSSITGE